MTQPVTEKESNILRKALIASTELIDEGNLITNQPTHKKYRQKKIKL